MYYCDEREMDVRRHCGRLLGEEEAVEVRYKAVGILAGP